ncbi:aminoglycoside phosphotransferase family protein [Nocardiopsis sp. RSe5-2]|uniref:Aminoglycoside phosphotransferase family protein n=1 Tax=Nocardiopsis endophytica TaxID=3018445 RepID=A0ABT4TYN6_9ACTN|nr:aminoglycoside phosphotransferase family protein [Nocardiopsis endophytica]MDA2809800.1 aminoglycoside phosphotransferase family protein [Nocardiopsis endophytica]
MAGAILREHGEDLLGAERGRGWTNATWLADELVVRVATRPGTTDLLREVRLVGLLPEEVGYPPIVGSGVRDGHEWVLTRRVAGQNLEEVWPSLDPAARSRAVEQMWERARHIHRVDAAAAAPHARPRSPFFPRSPGEAWARLERLVAAGELTAPQAEGLGRVLDRFWAALPSAAPALNHGDLCTPNTLWRDGRVVALLDLEFAVVAPTAVDLNETVKTAFGPDGSDSADRHDGRGDRAPRRGAVARIAESALEAAGGPDVLVGYSVMLETWVLENESAADEPDRTDRDNAAAMLAAFAEGDGGHYAPLLAGLGRRAR